MSTITIAGRKVGPGHPVLVVAEIGGNHNRDIRTAEALVHAVAECGADAIKVQVFGADEMCIDSNAKPFRLNWQGQETTLHSLYEQTAMPLEWHESLKALADSLGILYFGSVFSQSGIDLAVRLGFPTLKVASFEITDTNLVRACAKTGLPIILSTGMATADEIGAAIALLDDRYPNPEKTILLKCTSAYPAPASDANLRTLKQWSGVFGLSDHNRSDAVVCAAVALGACVVERHLKLHPRTLEGLLGTAPKGPDEAFSDTPDDFRAMVAAIRETEAALGTIHYGPTESEKPMLRFRRSLWTVADIAAGETITPDNVRCLRPADGLEPKHYDAVMGKRAKVAIERGTPLAWGYLE